MYAKTLSVIVLSISVFTSQSVMAWGDRSSRTAEQWQKHEQYKRVGLAAWKANDVTGMIEAARDIAVREAYLTVSDVSPRDPRLVGRHWQSRGQGRVNLAAAWGAVFHAELRRRTGFRMNLDEVFADTRFDRLRKRHATVTPSR